MVMAGFISGAVAALCVWPFETIRSQRQVVKVNISLRECALTIYKKESILGFYKGIGCGMLGMSMFYGCYFLMNGYLRDKNYNPFISSYISANLSALLNNGFYVMRTRKQTELVNPSFLKEKKSSKSLVGILRKEGFRVWTRGLVITWIKNVELGGIAFSREYLRDNYNIPLIFATFGSKVAFGLITYPLDTARTLRRFEETPLGYHQMLNKFYTNPSSAYRGCGMYLLRSVPSTFIAFTIHDILTNI